MELKLITFSYIVEVGFSALIVPYGIEMPNIRIKYKGATLALIVPYGIEIL